MSIGLGIIGLGGISIGRMIPAALESSTADLRAAADVDGERRAIAGQLVPPMSLYSDYHDLLERPDIDLVYIATPNVMHCRQTVEALEAGKHVLCEKPMALSAIEAQQMVDAAARTRRLLAIGYMTRHNPVIKALREEISRGKVGRIQLVRVHFSYSIDRSHASIRHGFRTAREQDGGGPVYDIGCYPLDAITYVLDDHMVEVKSVLARNRGWPCHDAAVFVGTLERSHVPVTVEVTFDFNRQSFYIVGETATLLVEGCFGQTPVGRIGYLRSAPASMGTSSAEVDWLIQVQPGDLPHYQMYKDELDLICRCITEDRTPENSGLVGLRHMQTIDVVLGGAREDL